MALDRRAREALRANCDEIRDDDAVDPRVFFSKQAQNRSNNKKARQLCRQVAETLDQVLAGDLGDDALRCLRVATVVPAPDTSRMLVTLHADCDACEFDRARIERRLFERTGRLRCEIASAITRRKAPALTFVVIGPDIHDADGGKEAAR